MEGFRTNHSTFFKNSLYDMDWVIYNSPLTEEFKFRLPLYALVFYLTTRTKIYNKEYENLINFFLWFTLLLPTIYWAFFTGHYMGLSVFTVGMTWGWLIIKTKRIWPAITCHMIDNFTIVLAIRLYDIIGVSMPEIAHPKNIDDVGNSVIEITNILIKIITA
jgi:hypothetical protein